jgi:DNA-binding NarL/FixJ family response regulator
VPHGDIRPVSAPAAHARPRTAVLVDSAPGWLATVEPVVAAARVEVVGRTTSSHRAVPLVRERQPTLLVIGLRMPPGEPDGLDLIGPALSASEGLRVIVAAPTAAPADVEAAFAAGACAFVVKAAAPEDLAAAVRMAFAGTVFLGAPATGLTALGPGPEPLARLTRREREILQLVSEGHTNAELAHMLWVTEQTVKFHLSNVYRKLEVSNRTEASRWAQRAGLLAAA